MATYDDLRRFFEDNGYLRETASMVAKFRIVFGVLIDVHPLWCLFYDLEDGILPIREGDLFQWLETSRVMSGVRELPPWQRSVRIEQILQGLVTRGYRSRDLNRSVAGWQNFNGSFDEPREHVTITAAYRAPRPPQTGVATFDEFEELRGLTGLAREYPKILRIEERSEPQLSIAAGGEILTGAGNSGTLGGALTDTANGNILGMTCAHVVQPYDGVSDTKSVFLGSCEYAAQLSALKPGASIDPMAYPPPSPWPGNSSDINMLDVALVRLSAAPTTKTPLAGIAAQLSQGLGVKMKGAMTAASGTLGSLALAYNFVSGGQTYCFRDAVEFKPQSSIPLGGGIGTLLARCPQQGDSGAWVTTDSSTPDWAGMIFGEDGQRAFMIRASWLHGWAEQETGVSLSV